MREFERFPTSGANALNADFPLPFYQVANIDSYRKTKKEVPAFKPEFYEKASEEQIEEDVVSYLGEYRFEVSEFDYKINIRNGQLLDPKSGEEMTAKAQKAIEDRVKNGKSSNREEAELLGLQNLEQDLLTNPLGTVVWFSPPGPEEEGYGEYGFAFVGKIKGESLDMTAVRLEKPTLADFNRASDSLWGINYLRTEGFLSSPQVIDISPDEAKDFIKGSFELGDPNSKEIFGQAKVRLKDRIKEWALLVHQGADRKVINEGLYALENMSLEIKDLYKKEFKQEVIYIPEIDLPSSLAEAMLISRYTAAPPVVKGSCGMSGKIESSNTLGKLLGSSDSTLNKSNQEWFSCPKCTYKADGPIGNKCPGCGLTKEQFVEEGGENCD